MIADRKDTADLFQKRHGERQQALLPMARLLAGAAPVMDGLQRTTEWERYVTILQGMLERYQAGKKAAQDKLGDPSIVNDDEVRKLRQGIFIADVSMDTLKFAIELPAAILKGGEEANQFIKDFEKKNEPTGPAQS